MNSKEGEIAKCPFCGLKVIMEHSKLTLHHEAPICQAFKDKMKSFNLKPVQTGYIPWRIKRKEKN